MKKFYIQPTLSVVSLGAGVFLLANSSSQSKISFAGSGEDDDEAESRHYEGGLLLEEY